jgi:hypothetical protein
LDVVDRPGGVLGFSRDEECVVVVGGPFVFRQAD